MADTELLIVRHPETSANISGRFVGQGESPFTDRGRLQARRLPRKIARFEPEVIWTSPLLRARSVAEKAARLSGQPLKVDDRLMELDFGSAHGMTWDEIMQAEIAFNYESASLPVAPGGESRDDLELRVGGVFDEIVAQGGRHAVVCHAGVMRAALVHVLGFGRDQIWAFSIHNAQLAYVRVTDGRGMLEEYARG